MPVPFRVVRTRFLGAIATPITEPAPMEMASTLWGGKLPAFRHARCSQRVDWRSGDGPLEPSLPASGTFSTIPPHAHRCPVVTRWADSVLARVLPERAHKALGAMAEVRAMVEGVHELPAIALNRSLRPAPRSHSVIFANSRESRSTRCTNLSYHAYVRDGRCCKRCPRQNGCALTSRKREVLPSGRIRMFRSAPTEDAVSEQFRPFEERQR